MKAGLASTCKALWTGGQNGWIRMTQSCVSHSLRFGCLDSRRRCVLYQVHLVVIHACRHDTALSETHRWPRVRMCEDSPKACFFRNWNVRLSEHVRNFRGCFLIVFCFERAFGASRFDNCDSFVFRHAVDRTAMLARMPTAHNRQVLVRACDRSCPVFGKHEGQTDADLWWVSRGSGEPWFRFTHT